MASPSNRPKDFSLRHVPENKGAACIAVISGTTGVVALVASVGLGVILILAPQLVATAGGPWLFVATGMPALVSLISLATFTLVALRGPKRTLEEDPAPLTTPRTIPQSDAPPKQGSLRSPKRDTHSTPSQKYHSASANLGRRRPPLPQNWGPAQETPPVTTLLTGVGLGERPIPLLTQGPFGDASAPAEILNDADSDELSDLHMDDFQSEDDEPPSTPKETLLSCSTSRYCESEDTSDSDIPMSQEASPLHSSPVFGTLTHTIHLSYRVTVKEEQPVNGLPTPLTVPPVNSTTGYDNVEMNFEGIFDTLPDTFELNVPEQKPKVTASLQKVKAQNNTTHDEEWLKKQGDKARELGELIARSVIPVSRKDMEQVAQLNEQERLKQEKETKEALQAITELETQLAEEKRVEDERLAKEGKQRGVRTVLSEHISVKAQTYRSNETKREQERLKAELKAKQETARQAEKEKTLAKIQADRTRLVDEMQNGGGLPVELFHQIFISILRQNVNEFASIILTCTNWKTIASDPNGPVYKKYQRVFVRAWIPKLFEKGRRAAIALVSADHMLIQGTRQASQLQAKVQELKTTFSDLENFITETILNSPVFILKNLLANYLKYKKVTRLSRQMTTAIHYENQIEFARLYGSYTKANAQNNLHEIITFVYKANFDTPKGIQSFITSLPGYLKPHFSLDDPSVTPKVSKLLILILDAADYNDPKLKEKLVALQGKVRDYNAFTKNLHELLFYLFDKAYASKTPQHLIDALYRKIMEEVLVKSASPTTVNKRIEGETKKVLQLSMKFLEGLDTYFKPKNDALLQELDYAFFKAEGSGIRNEKHAFAKMEKELYALQHDINKSSKTPVTLLFVSNTQKTDNIWAPRIELLKYCDQNSLNLSRSYRKKIMSFNAKHKGTIRFVKTRPLKSPLTEAKKWENSWALKMAMKTAGSNILLKLANQVHLLDKVFALDGLTPKQLTDWKKLVISFVTHLTDPVYHGLLTTNNQFRNPFEQAINHLYKKLFITLTELANSTTRLAWIPLIQTMVPLINEFTQVFEKMAGTTNKPATSNTKRRSRPRK